MKKLLLSALVVGLFIVYGFAKREQSQTGQVIVFPPIQPGSTTTPGTGLIQPTAQPVITASPVTNSPPVQRGQYKDGVYAGSVADAFYGNVQVQITVSGGRVTDVAFLQYPNDRNTSIMINSQAMPYLKQEALAAQSANVDIVSGATDTSQAFQQSLAAALAQAH